MVCDDAAVIGVYVDEPANIESVERAGMYETNRQLDYQRWGKSSHEAVNMAAVHRLPPCSLLTQTHQPYRGLSGLLKVDYYL